MELEPIDRKLLMLEAYVKVFDGDIEKAKQSYPEYIENKIKTIELGLINKQSARYKAVEAIKENKKDDYYYAMMDIKREYEIRSILSLQGTIMKKIREEQEEKGVILEPSKKERPTEPIIIIPEKTSREKYEELIDKYKNKMYDIRQKVEADKATQEEIDAFLAYNITELQTISKRKNAEKMIKEEASMIKKYLLEKATNNNHTNLLEAYQKELQEIGIDAAKIMKDRLNGF